MATSRSKIGPLVTLNISSWDQAYEYVSFQWSWNLGHKPYQIYQGINAQLQDLPLKSMISTIGQIMLNIHFFMEHEPEIYVSRPLIILSVH